MPGSVELSLVIPIYNERDNLAPLLEEIAVALRGASYEVVAVDDGSTDGSLAELKRLAAAHPGLRVVAFERNAGQTAAFAAGFRAARGAILVTLDADLQNDPADIPALVTALGNGDASAVANGVRNWLNGESIRDTGCSLKAFRAEAVRGLPLFNGMHRFLPTLVKLHGGRVAELPVRHRPRRSGRTKYGMWNRAWRALVDAFAVRWMQRRALKYHVTEEWP